MAPSGQFLLLAGALDAVNSDSEVEQRFWPCSDIKFGYQLTVLQGASPSPVKQHWLSRWLAQLSVVAGEAVTLLSTCVPRISTREGR